MKQHLGSSRQKVTTHAQFATADNEERGAVAVLTSITQQLAQQQADVQRQLAILTDNQPNQTTSPHKTQTFNKRPGKPENPPAHATRRATTSQPKPGYCFRCGEDDHIRPQCENEPNPTLVARKKKQFTQKQQNTTRHHQLN